jgi:hypothetical protein
MLRSVSAHGEVVRPTASACRRKRLWFATSFLVAAVSLQAQEALRIVPLVRDERVLVTFELADGFSEDVRAAILSGLKTTFTYTVDMRLDVPIWADRTISSSVVTTSVEYDNLTRRHTIVRMIDGRMEQSQVTEDQAVVKQWMTSFKQLPLFRTSLLLPNRDYYVRVSAVARPTNGSILWPWGSGTSAQAKFTFIR